MKKQMTSILAGAVITGLLTGAYALADTSTGTGGTAPTGVTGKKDGCNNKTAKDKDSCKGHKKKKKAKDGCNDKNGCSAKDKKGAAAPAPAPAAPTTPAAH